MNKVLVFLVIAAALGKLVHHIKSDPNRLSDNLVCSENESKRMSDDQFDLKCSRFDSKRLFKSD
jgi:hypothetical protein